MKIGILGAGTWGVALARMLSNTGHDVTVWSALQKEIEYYDVNRTHPNLEGCIIPGEVVFTGEMERACQGEIVIFAVPSVYIRDTARKACQYLKNDSVIVNVSKGIEEDTLKSLAGVMEEEFTNGGINPEIVVLSGPTHAEEVAKDLPTTIVATCKNEKTAELVQNVFMNTCMRVYTNNDVLGVELCGALKNIIALASGIACGLGYGDNAKAALITRGMVEITRLGVAMGCNQSTFSGLAGIGDLIVTATSENSRNYRAGKLIGQGMSPEKAIDEIGMVVEGINALKAAIKLCEKMGVEMPIVNAVNNVINKNADPALQVAGLMQREKKPESSKV